MVTVTGMHTIFIKLPENVAKRKEKKEEETKQEPFQDQSPGEKLFSYLREPEPDPTNPTTKWGETNTPTCSTLGFPGKLINDKSTSELKKQFKLQ